MAEVGRPTIYSVELAAKICKELAMGKSLRKVSEMEGMPSAAAVFEWLALYPEFVEQYAKACEERSEAQHEGLLDLGDEAIALAQTVDPKASGAVVQAVKLKADNLKWAMSKMKPKKYGDKVDLTTNGKDLPVPILGVVQNTQDKK